MKNPHETTPDPTSGKPSLDALAKRHELDEELDWAKAELLLETLETRGRDALDFHEIPVSAIRDVVRHAFERGYRSGLHAGYRQGRGDACDEAAGREAPSQPRNPDLTTTSNSTTT
jgi:hypothetical protein